MLFNGYNLKNYIGVADGKCRSSYSQNNHICDIHYSTVCGNGKDIHKISQSNNGISYKEHRFVLNVSRELSEKSDGHNAKKAYKDANRVNKNERKL